MGIPANGRVVVIDDEVEKEAVPLLNALAKRGVAARFYTGKRSDLPDSPPNGVRLLFLDLKLAGMEFINDAADLANALKPVLDRVIDKHNGPYVLIGWTKHPEHLKVLCESLTPPPTLWVDLEKASCMSGGICNLPRIIRALKRKLESLDAFRLLFLWEHLVNEAAYQTVNSFHAMYESDKDPNRVLGGLLYRLAEANLEQQIKDKPASEVLANALLTLNGPFLDQLETDLCYLRNYKGFEIDTPRTSASAVQSAVTAQINARLHLAKDRFGNAMPGNVYKPFNQAFKNLAAEVLRDHTENLPASVREAIRKTAKPCLVEVSALCDHAQGKWRRHRILPGFFVLGTHMKPIKRTEAMFVSPLLSFPAACPDDFRLIFDFSYLSIAPFRSLSRLKPLFRLRKDVVVEIQSRLARHINRPGVLAL